LAQLFPDHFTQSRFEPVFFHIDVVTQSLIDERVIVYRQAISLRISGRDSAILMSVLAAPDGSRLPCSHLRLRRMEVNTGTSVSRFTEELSDIHLDCRLQL